MTVRRNAVLLIVAVAILAAAPFWAASFTITLLNYIGIYALVALGVVLLTGVAGLTSFGQAAFVGIGAYATAWLTTVHSASPWLGLVFALALTGVVAALLGAITLRLGGHFLPLGTIAWGLSIFFLFGNLDALGGHNGLTGVPPIAIGSLSLEPTAAIYYLIWGVLVVTMIAVTNLLDSREGRAIRSLPWWRRHGGESRHQRVQGAAHRLRHRRAARRALGLALRPYEPLCQPGTVRSAYGHPIFVHGDPWRIWICAGSGGRCRADDLPAKCPAGCLAALLQQWRAARGRSSSPSFTCWRCNSPAAA